MVHKIGKRLIDNVTVVWKSRVFIGLLLFKIKNVPLDGILFGMDGNKGNLRVVRTGRQCTSYFRTLPDYVHCTLPHNFWSSPAFYTEHRRKDFSLILSQRGWHSREAEPTRNDRYKDEIYEKPAKNISCGSCWNVCRMNKPTVTDSL